MVKRLSTMWETWVRFLGWEDPLEKEMAIHSSTLAWKIPWRNFTFFFFNLFASGGQSIEVSASTSVLPMNIQD